MFVEVAVNLPPVRGTFHYHLPPELQNRVLPGHLVTAGFGSRMVQGVVLSLTDTSPVPETRPIETLLDPNPVITPAQMDLARWLADETLSPIIECITIMLPPGLSQQADSLYELLEVGGEAQSTTEGRLLQLLEKRGPLRGRQIKNALPRMAWKKAAEDLLRRGVIDRSSILQPPSVHPRHVRTARLSVHPDTARERVTQIGRANSKAAKRRAAIVETLIAEVEPLEVTWIYAESGGSFADLRTLEAEGLIALSEAEVWRDPLTHLDFIPTEAPTLTRDQSVAWEKIVEQFREVEGQKLPFLLHGVTGSGKTEIYLRAVAEAIDDGRGAIVLVPEISLTPQTIRRFVARFPGQVGLVHSQLSKGERYDTWRRCRSGDLKVVVGPRSALFTPMPDIGLIILDESHDESYKEQGQVPRYHARETAITYAKILNAICILGSATPDITTMFRVEQGELQYVTLPQRILGHHQRIQSQSERLGIETNYRPIEAEADTIELPPIRVVDMRQELRAGNRSIFSRPLQAALADTLQAGHQAILFLNRRGLATYIFCRDCGEALHCPRCETPLTFHRGEDELLCHHCGYQRHMPAKCPNCGSQRIKQFGAGTQLIERVINETFPEARTLRWDRDTTRKKGSHEVILAHFAAHRADLLIGTQMIAKGLDIPLVTLVGVVSADVGLNMPDYRSAERVFQVLTQVAGRAGRGILGGHVILQTYQPEHYAIQAASEHDYGAFYKDELHHRQTLGYPPFKRLARLLFRHHNAQTAERETLRLAGALRKAIVSSEDGAELIGPVPCFFMKLRGEFRWHIIIRADQPARWIPETLPEGWIVDVDPVSLL